MRVEIGQKIKSLRLGAELTQAELAARAQLTKGFISQVENDQVSISLESLNDILQALDVSLGEFFSSSNQRKVVYGPKDRVPVSGKGASEFSILVPGSTNKDMDPLYVTFEPGEAFETYKAPAKSCFYFEATQPHRLMNTTERKVTFLWVTAPPLM